MLAARLLLAITMVFTYPMECYVARHCIFAAINECYVAKSPPTRSPPAAITSPAPVLNPVQIEKTRSPVDSKRDPEVGTGVSSLPATAVSQPHLAIHVAVTLALWTISVTIAIVFGDLAIIFALTGALSASFLGYILPALLYLVTYASQVSDVIACCNKSSPSYESCAKTRMKRLSEFAVPVVMLIFGIFALIVGVATVIYGLVKENEE